MGKWCLGKPGSLGTWFPKEALWAQQVLAATRRQEMHSAVGCGRSPKSRPRGSPQGFQHRNPQASPEETPPLSETYRGSDCPEMKAPIPQSSPIQLQPILNRIPARATLTWPVSSSHTQDTTTTTY